jgi:glycosyltransferase involved in cell wall biosynthesis
MRVLFVNWVDDRDAAGRGGGVRLYQRNVLAALAARPDVETGVLSAGLAHSLRPGRPRVLPVPSAPGERTRRWVLVDSGVLAPAHADYGNPAQLAHPATEAALARFLAETGPWDAVHFNNLEGLPAAALAVARAAGARVILSLHNYYPLCPQVNLWRRETEACTDFDQGAACVGCLPVRPNRGAIRLAYALEWRLGRFGLGHPAYERLIRPALARGWRAWKRLRAAPPSPRPAPPSPRPAPQAEAAAFAARRAAMVAAVNAHCHRVLCVSDRVRQIALAHGIAPGLAATCYIGTPHAAAWARTAPRAAFLAADGTLRLAYLGYMRADKGFPFLMAALGALPADRLARLHLTVAARPGAPADMAAMAALAPRLASLSHRPGYAQAELDALLADIDLGLVPPLWEDALPQVALEMHARHIPLLCSDRGGAAELQACPDLVFAAGDIAAFGRALGRVLDGAITPPEAFRAARAPVTPEAHLDELMAHWRG